MVLSDSASLCKQEKVPLHDQQRRAFFDHQAQWWDEIIEDYTQCTFFEHWWKAVAPEQGQRVLEVGCGTGRLLPHYARATGRSGQTIGGDVSAPMLYQAAKRVLKSGENVVLVQMDARGLPLCSHQADVIYIINTFPHLQPFEVALQECYRVLSASGRLEIAHFASREHINNVHCGEGGIIATDLIPPITELQEILSECGFTTKRAEDTSDYYWITAHKR